MSKWFLRGLVFAALMVVIRLIQGVLINAFEAQSGLISLILVVLFSIGVFVWGRSDGQQDAKANPDPDRRDDLAMTWLGAGLTAGGIGGFVAWFIGLFYKGLYTSTFVNELTSFAAFTALLVFVTAVAAVTLGRRRVDKDYEKNPVQHHGLAAEAQPTTDVFATVGAPAEAAEEAAAAQTVADVTPAAPTEGFTTEEIVVDTAVTTEIPVIVEDGPQTQPGDSAK
ncbi:B-4DMT family transporter [Mycolicibacter minnesotensis]